MRLFDEVPGSKYRSIVSQLIGQADGRLNVRKFYFLTLLSKTELKMRYSPNIHRLHMFWTAQGAKFENCTFSVPNPHEY